MPTWTTFIKEFSFENITPQTTSPTIRPEVQLSDTAKIKWSDERRPYTLVADVPEFLGSIELVKLSDNTYDEGTVLTWTTTPNKLKNWLAFEEFSSTPADTDISHRLVTGGIDYYWDSASWVAATDPSLHWNDEQTISINISSFQPGNQDLAIKSRLRSLVKRKTTPRLFGIKILMEVDHITDEELLYRTIVRQLRLQVRAVYDYKLALLSNTDTIDLNDAATSLDNSELKVVGLDAAYNETDDPDLMSNIASSYAGGVITLSSVQDQGDVILLKLLIEPIVAVTTGQNYYETAGPCAITLEDVRHPLRYRGNRSKMTTVRQPDSNPGVSHKGHAIPEGYSLDYEITGRYITTGGVDSMRLVESIRRFLHGTRRLFVPSIDEPVDITIVEEPETAFRPNLADIHEGNFTFNARFVSLRPLSGVTVDLVRNFNPQGVSP